MRLGRQGDGLGGVRERRVDGEPNATATNTAGKIRPPRNPLVPATSSASSFTTGTEPSPPTV